MADSITLPRSGIVLERNSREDCPEYVGPLCALIRGPISRPTFVGMDHVVYFTGYFEGRVWSRDECIAWLDDRVLETRAALLAGDGVRDTIEDAIADVETCTPGCLAPSDVADIARAVLRALGGQRG